MYDPARQKEAIKLAQRLGEGVIQDWKAQGLSTQGASALEEGALQILRGRHWANGFQQLLGTLELQGPKFFQWSPPTDEPTVTRSIGDYSPKAVQMSQLEANTEAVAIAESEGLGPVYVECTVPTLEEIKMAVLNDDERKVFDDALTGDHKALISLLQQCPEMLLFQEFSNGFIELLNKASGAPKASIAAPGEAYADYRDLIRDLLPARQSGEVPVNDDDIKLAYYALHHHYKQAPSIKSQSPSEAAQHAIANELNLSPGVVKKKTKGLLPPNRQPPKDY